MLDNLLNTENRAIESSVLQDKVNNSNLYLDETDSNGVPLLKRVEKYPDLPEDEFIPIEYTHSNGLKIPKDIYFINKLGEVKNVKNGFIYTKFKQRNYLRVSIKVNSEKLSFSLHRLVASTFLENPNPSVYKLVNHIDHDPENNNLSNLEWVTPAENSNVRRGKSSGIPKNKLTNYIALDNNGDELFRVTRFNNKGYDVGSIISSIKDNITYKGYKWSVDKDKNKRREEIYKLIGYSGNLNDYEWHEHWKYPGYFVCKEGFIKHNDNFLYYIDNSGYVRLGIYYRGKYIKMNIHRVIMEFILRRELKDNEVVDHINTIKHDNSFSNLRVTDNRGNMNNPLTIEKIAKRVVLSNLYGDFIGYYFAREVYDFLGKKNNERYRTDLLLISDIVGKRYICIELEDKETLHKKMERVIYVFNKDKTKVLGAFDSAIGASRQFQSSRQIIITGINSGELTSDGNYYLRGPEAVKLVLSLGHGTAGNYKPEDDKNNTESA